MTKIEAEKKIREEYEELSNNPNIEGLTVRLFDRSNIFKWRATLSGPIDTSYKGGLFILSVNFPDDYPNHPPEVCFITPIYHVNVNPIKSNEPGTESLGHICISILNKWKPEYKMKEVFYDIFALFYKTDLDSPYGLDRADEFRYKRALYEEKIKYFTEKYANPNYCNIEKKYNISWDFSYTKTEIINPAKKETVKRIKEEYKDFIRNYCSGLAPPAVHFDENNVFKWKATFMGPKDTSYKGGIFILSIDFPDDYPNNPPEICFITPIYHVNVNPNKSNEPGAISLGHVDTSILYKWGPENKMREVLTNIYALFYLANPDSPYEFDMADEYRNNRFIYEEKIKYFTNKYAHPRYCDIDKEYDNIWDFSFN